MDDNLFNKLIEENEYYKSLLEYNIYLSKSDLSKYDQADKIVLNDEEISSAFLLDLFDDEEYSYELVELLMNKIPAIKVGVETNEEIETLIEITKSKLAGLIKKGLDDKVLTLDERKSKIAEKLFKETSIQTFLEDNYYNERIEIIDGVHNSYSISEMIKLILSSDNDYENLLQGESIGGKARDYFLYAMIKYFKQEKIFDKYLFDKKYSNRFKELASLEKIDLQALNKIYKSDSDKVANISLDPSLKEELLSSIPSDYDDLEKALHVYIKICKTFSYDDEFFVIARPGMTLTPYGKDHQITMSLDNRKLVCYELNNLYAKCLDELAINYEINEKTTQILKGKHNNLSFRAGKFLVTADTTTSIFSGDLFAAKIGDPLVGLKCHNKNKASQQEFSSKKEKVYQRLNGLEDFDKKLDDYLETKPLIKAVSFDEKLAIIYKRLEKTKLLGMDALSYLLKMRKMMFNEEEQLNNFSVSVIRDNISYSKIQTTGASAVITINSQSFEEEADKNIYYFYSPGTSPRIIDKDELVSNFKVGDMAYIDINYYQIPGLEEGAKVR